MDNGLIFPYPCVRARDESVLVLTTQTRWSYQDPFGGRWTAALRGTFELVVVKRRGDAGR